MCLIDTKNDPLARRPLKTSVTISSGTRKHILSALVDSGCLGAYTVINRKLVPEICEKLQIQPILLPKPKPIRGYDGRLADKPIIDMILPKLIVHGHEEATCPILIADLQHDMILGKPWMNKHGVLLDMMVDKLLFVPGRCNHDGDIASALKDLSFIPDPTTRTRYTPDSPPII